MLPSIHTLPPEPSFIKPTQKFGIPARSARKKTVYMVYTGFLFFMYIFLPHVEAREPHSMVILFCANLNFVKGYSVLNLFSKKNYFRCKIFIFYITIMKIGLEV